MIYIFVLSIILIYLNKKHFRIQRMLSVKSGALKYHLMSAGSVRSLKYGHAWLNFKDRSAFSRG